MWRLVRLGLGSFTLTSVLTMGGFLWEAAIPEARARVEHPDLVVARVEQPGEAAEPPMAVWLPPAWFPEDAVDGLGPLDGIGGEPVRDNGPALRSRAAFVYDLDSGEVLLERRADDRRPVASLTKVVTSLTALSENPDLEAELCVDASMWPGWPGAWSKLNTGVCTTGWDLLGAALVASDNRAAYGLWKITGLPFYPFVERMNDVAADLGMDMSEFSDPSGAEDENLSTARDMTRAIVAAAAHPVLSNVASAPWWDVEETQRPRVRRLFSTNRMIGEKRTQFLAAKTGYTDTARYCFTAVVQTASGRRVAFTLLGANGTSSRWADVRRVLSWVENG